LFTELGATTADAVFLASYTHAAKQFTTLFPAMAPQFPDVLTLTSGEIAAAASPLALYALRHKADTGMGPA
jgi:hypothetical protein